MDDITFQKMWQYIKVMQYFTIMEIKLLLALDANSTINFNYIDIYLKYLHDFNIIKAVEDDNYVLNKDLGELAPKIFDYQVLYDPNEDKIITMTDSKEESFITKNVYIYNGGKNDKAIH